MTDTPITVAMIHNYLEASGWVVALSGTYAQVWQTWGSSLRVPVNPTGFELDKAVFELSLVENLHPEEVRDKILAAA